MIEAGLPRRRPGRRRTPVAELHAVSHDPTLSTSLDAARRPPADRPPAAGATTASRRASSSRTGTAPTPTPQTLDVLARWESVLDRLERRPEALRRRARLGGQAGAARGLPRPRRPRLGRARSCSCRPAVRRRPPGEGPLPPAGRRRADGAAARRRGGRGRACTHPPEDTRAYFRGECLRRYAEQVAAASWDSVIFDVPGRRVAAAGADARAAARHQGARRRPARPQRGRRGARRGADWRPATGDERSDG